MSTDETAGIRSILIIDDDHQFRGYLRELLEANGFTTHEATNGEMGLTAYEQYGPDLVLTDIIMPEKEGLEMIKDLKKLDPQAQVIAMTGGGNYGFCNNYVQLAKVMGAYTALVKPFRADALIQAIRDLEAA